MHVASNGELRVVAQFAQGTADIGAIAESNTVLIPHMNENRVAAYNLPEAFR